MKRRWKILGLILAALIALAVVNTLVTNSETQPARATVEGAEILSIPGGDLQVLDLPATDAATPAEESAGQDGERGQSEPAAAPPIVLIHGYTASMNWWQEVIPALNRRHRVIAVDLLGHGGSAKPGSGYSVPSQADLIAQALNQLEVEGAVVIGHSLGGAVATALAERASQLVDRLIIVGMAPAVDGFGSLDLTSRLSRLPVIGQASKRLAPDALLRSGLQQGFAPDFPVPDFAVEDVNAMTYTAYHDWPPANEQFTEERPLNERIEQSFVPLMVVFGAEDQIFDARSSISAYAALPGTRTELLEDVGHSPQVEAPEETAALILDFAKPAPEPTSEQPQQAKPNAKQVKKQSRNQAQKQTKQPAAKQGSRNRKAGGKQKQNRARQRAQSG